LENLQAAWRPLGGRVDLTAVVHVGFDRPDTPEFEEIASRFPGRLLLTASARYAFPTEPDVAQNSAGTVQNLPVFVVLSGWGYTCTVEELGLHEDANEIWEQGPPPVFAPRDWVAEIQTADFALAAAAASAGIVDESTYLANECMLNTDQRIRLAEFRLQLLAGTAEPTDPLVIVQHAPPWLLDLRTSSLDLTVRVANVFASGNIVMVRDLIGYSENDLLRLQNFGRKSLTDLAVSLLAALRKGPSTEAERTASAEASTLVALLRHDLAALPKRPAHILRRRMGLDAPRGTLQEIGDEFGVTRERVRQVEAKYVRKMRRFSGWRDLLLTKLEHLLTNRTQPLLFEGLEILDHWFSGIDRWPDAFAYLLDAFCDRQFSLLHINRTQSVVSALSQDGWAAAVSEAHQILDSGVGRDWNEEQARALVEGLLPGSGHELCAELWRAVTPLAHFAATDGRERILTGIGRGVEHIVEAVLTESDRPLHYSEIAQRASARAGRSIDIRRANNAAANVGLLYGRGTYGLQKHLPLTEEEADLVVAQAEDLIENGLPDRQWHAVEICDALGERGLDFDGRLTPYVVSIALMRSSACAYLGRLVWTLRGDRALSTAHRIDVRQAIISFLRQEGRPMTTSELRDRLIHERGVSQYFQVFQAGPVVRLSGGLWGLIDRDIDLAPAEQTAVADELAEALERLGHGLHVTEVAEALTATRSLAEKIKDPALLCTIAQRTGRIKISPGQYIYLADWEGPRRHSVSEALRKIFAEATDEGLTLAQIEDAVRQDVGRLVPRTSISAALQAFGALWNRETGRWHAPGTTEDANMADLQTGVAL
jgi:hypothetical protein